MPQITTEWIRYLNHFVHPLWLGCSLFSLTHSSLETALSSCLTMQKSMLPQIKTYIHALLVVIIWIVPLYTALVEVILSLYLFIIYHAWNFTGCISSKLPELQTKKQKSKTLFLTHFFLQMGSLYCSAKKDNYSQVNYPQIHHVIPQGCRFVPYTFPETKPQMVPKDLCIGFQGLALIQGQIYNPVIPLCSPMLLDNACWKRSPSTWRNISPLTLCGASAPFHPTAGKN